METLATADGKPVDLDQTDAEFAKAMTAPRSDDPEAPAPPKRDPADPEAPFGRNDDGTVKAPYGLKADGSVRRSAGGRPPRMIEAPKGAQGNDKDKGKGKPQGGGRTAQEYAQGLAEFLGGVQLVLAVVPIPNENIRVHARYQAAVIEQTGDGLATGVGTVAEHNAMVRWGVEKITQGGGAWIFPAVMAIAPFAVSTAMLWNAPVTPEMAAGAKRIEDEAMARLKAEMGFEDQPPAQERPQPAAA